jgi:hypothetical protein
MIPSNEERATQKLESDDLQETKSRRATRILSGPPKIAGAGNPTSTPFTPRTLAFNTLDRQLPLRKEEPSRFA